MPSEDVRTLSEARLEHAGECLHAAKSLLTGENYRSAANRAYYAVFHAMRAVLAYDGIDMKHHSGVISSFRRLYIKTGILDSRLSEIISAAYDLRTGSDYDDFFEISGDEVAEQIENAAFFLNQIRCFLNENHP